MSTAVYKHCVPISTHSLISTTIYHQTEEIWCDCQEKHEEICSVVRPMWLLGTRINGNLTFNGNKQLSPGTWKMTIKCCVWLSFSLLRTVFCLQFYCSCLRRFGWRCHLAFVVIFFLLLPYPTFSL